MEDREQQLRRRLGIPADATNVLVFGESSHWDPNWLLTSEQYYRLRIERILDSVIAALEEEPRRVFAIECLFFLKLYWERRPDARERVRQLIGDRRLRLTGTGITTPDTVLPGTEVILRDFLVGYRWLVDHGLHQDVRLAYFPDSFGHSPLLPSILGAQGVTHAAVTRIDGMHFIGSDYRSQDEFPLPGSSAEHLLRHHRTLDFIWQAPDGSEVLCHWNAFTYFQGDMLAHLGVIRWMGLSFGLPWRTEGHVARRVEGFVEQLRPVSRTPYLFCPMGCDFNSPIRDLLPLLDRYNSVRYPETGVWVLNAGLDDYLDLVDLHREKLPTLRLDPNPYWMGFYASRPEIKQRCNRIAGKLLLAESLEASGDRKGDGELEAAWELAALTNHHDFITGTAPDRVWRKEQQSWLHEAESRAERVLRTPAAPVEDLDLPRWSLKDGRLMVENQHYRLHLDEEVGGCIVSLVASGDQLLSAPGNDLVAYRDSGGLWRMGHEFRGGVFEEHTRASQAPARIEAEPGEDGALQVRVRSELAGRPFERLFWFRRDSPVIRGRIVGAAAHRRTITCSLPLAFPAREVVMDVPGGVVSRPARKLFTPTFWPASTFAHVRAPGRGHGLAAFLEGPACVTLGDGDALEWVVLRNAPLERAFGVLPIPAHPASGADPAQHSFDYALCLTPAGDYRQNRLPWLARRLLRRSLGVAADPCDDLLRLDRNDLLVSAVKRASDGRGLVVRLLSFSPEGGEVRLAWRGERIQTAWACDALERELGPLEVRDGEVRVPLNGTINSLRFELEKR